MKRSLLSLVAVSALAAAPNAVSGQFLTPVSPSCVFSSVFAVNSMTQYTSCGGAYAGNDANQVGDVVNQISALGWGDFSYGGTTDEGQTTGPFSSVDGTSTGSVILDSPISGPFVLALKANNQFSLYYFANLVGETQFDFDTWGVAVNQNQKAQGLSHASAYVQRTVEVPAPSTWLLLASGVFVFLGMAYRRRESIITA